ncbi:MAG: YIP1 family protein [Litoreibacter sp.]
MSTTQTILRSYRAPGAVARELRARGADEMMVLTWLVIACVLFFVARLPGLARVAHFNGDDTPLFGLALGTFFGTIFLAPVVFFALAGLSHLVARIFGAAGSYLDARIALFWSLLAITPLVLLQGLVAGLIGQGPQLSLVSGIVFVGFLYIWIGGLMALEKRH